MHDPMTVAHEIKYPWWQHKPWPKRFRHKDHRKFIWEHEMNAEDKKGRAQMWPEGYRNTFITICHVDPCRGRGGDDSCGYSYVQLTDKQVERLKNTAWWEGRLKHFLCGKEKAWTGGLAEAECLYRGMVLLVARVLDIPMTFDRAAKHAAESIHIRTSENAGGCFCFVPGYHTNNKQDRESDRVDHFTGILCGIAKSLLTERRPWYRHPKWHFWHWKFQCHALLDVKRWLFSRCCRCGKRFAWRYCPVTDNWNSEGPKWFRGEKDCYHSDCNRPTDNCVAETPKAV